MCWKRLLNCKEIKSANPKGNQPWVFIGRTDAEAETPIFWPPDVKNWLIGKDPDAGKDWRQEEKGMTEDEVIGWHHRLYGHESSKLRKLVMDREALRAAMCGYTKSRTWLSTDLNWTECSARNNPPLAVHNSISFSPVSQCHFMSFLEFTISNVLHYITWPRQRRDYIGHSLAAHCSQGSGRVCCVCLQLTHECSLVWHYHVGFTLTSLWNVDDLTGPRS